MENNNNMKPLRFAITVLLFFVVWSTAYLLLDFASQAWHVDDPRWLLGPALLLQLASAVYLAYRCAKTGAPQGALPVKAFVWRLLVLLVAGLAALGFILLIAIAVFSERG
jgi:hypothetical protein